MTLKTKWINLIYNLATRSRKIGSFFTPLGALFFSLTIFSIIIISLLVDKLLGITDILPRSLSLILASLLFLVAFILIGWSVLTFLRAKGTPVPVSPPPRLVTTGPYAYTRNPMLTGVFALFFGIGVLLESFSLLVIFTPLFILVNVWELKAIEEPELLKRLGQDYVEYRKSTPMFFPSLRKIFKRIKS
ncbi:MAG: isoprenylcysteine carboxylmethyltransferase family protein [Candidatus Aminicenantes bacterium]|nr:MAG: isoprenylcysteine carboxylmethyltransferase family protein [Candidatus Aminicenantes bacterium]